MTAIAFDTYKLIAKLRSRGFSEEQAIGINEAIQEIDLSTVASKADIQEVRNELSDVKTELKNDIQQVKTELKAEMRETEYRLIIRVGSIMFIGFGFLAAIKFFGS